MRQLHGLGISGLNLEETSQQPTFNFEQWRCIERLYEVLQDDGFWHLDGIAVREGPALGIRTKE